MNDGTSSKEVAMRVGRILVMAMMMSSPAFAGGVRYDFCVGAPHIREIGSIMELARGDVSQRGNADRMINIIKYNDKQCIAVAKVQGR